jgi:hypothetical protein
MGLVPTTTAELLGSGVSRLSEAFDGAEKLTILDVASDSSVVSRPAAFHLRGGWEDNRVVEKMNNLCQVWIFALLKKRKAG